MIVNFKKFQPFQKFVQIGRVAVIQEGPLAGKIAAVVDVIDQNRVSTRSCVTPSFLHTFTSLNNIT